MFERQRTRRLMVVAVSQTLLLTVFSATVPKARAQAQDEPRPRTPEQSIGHWVVSKRPKLEFQGRSQDFFVEEGRKLRVIKTNGRRLLVKPEALTATGWVSADQVVLATEAVGYFTGRIRNDPRDGYAYLRRAMAWGDRNELDRVLADLDQAERFGGDSAVIHRLRGRVRLIRKDYDAAIVEANRAIRLDPQDAIALETRGGARRGKKDLSGAIADLNQAIQLFPGSHYFYVNRGTIWYEIGDKDRAILDFTAAIRLDPEDAVSYESRGRVLVELGQYDSAKKDFDRAIRLEPKRAELYAIRGFVAREQGNDAAAVNDSETAIRLDPNCWLAYVNRGSFRLNRRELGAALADFERAIRLNPRHARARLGRGNVREQLQDLVGALADYDEAARLAPTLAAAHNNAAWIRATSVQPELRDGKKAVAAATRACELTKWKDANLIDTLAAACAEAGDFDAAIKWQSKAITMFTDADEKARGAARVDLYRARTAYRAPKP